MQREVSALREIGCCALCQLRFQSFRSQDAYLSVPKDVLLTPESQKCVACLGVLPLLATSTEWHDRIKQAIDGYPDAATFSIAYSFPVSTVLRQVLIAIYHADVVGIPFTDPMDIKEVARWVTQSAFAECGGKTFELGSPLLVHLHVSHPETAEEHLFLQGIPSAQFTIKKAYEKGRAVMQGEGPTHVENALRRVKPGELKRATDIPPKRLENAAVLETVKVEHAPIYLGGRYFKHDRLTSQTRWITEGDFKVDQSVEQFLGEPASVMTQSSSYAFMAAGREDVDVRMLGRGRPFALTLHDPHRTRLTAAELRELEEKALSTSGGAVAIRELCLVHKSSLQILKDGEADKRKTYSCIVRASRRVEDSELSKLAGMTDVVLAQDTPLRVLHRRSPATRPKTVHSMLARRLSDTYFRLQLTTQAGTYVKEFVHGDLGRTRPHLGQLLGENCDTDLIELDVVDVQLAWPPSTPADVPVEAEGAAAGSKRSAPEDEQGEDEDVAE